jgi:histidyl-tRNA synthetase
VPLGELLALKVALTADGARVRLEQRPKNLKALLERAASDGYTSFATVSAGATVEALEFKPLR